MAAQRHPTSIRLSDELKRDLKAVAAWRKWPFATTIVHALTEWTSFQKQQMGKKK